MIAGEDRNWARPMSYVDAILLSALFSASAFLLALLIGKIGETQIEGRPEMKAAELVIPRRAQMETRFDLRSAELTQEIAKLAAEVTGLRRRRFAMERELQDARREADSPVRMIGREGSTPQHFRAWMVNRQVQTAVAESKTHPTLDVGWAVPQIIEVWADNLGEARKELQRIYPPPLGFTILNVRQHTEEEQKDA